jgi:hypothetical protein
MPHDVHYQMRSKQLTILSTFILHLQLGSVEGYYSSSPGVARQLEYTPREEPVIRTSRKKAFVQPPVFNDTEGSTRSKVMLPHWGDLFNKNIQEEYLEYIPHSDPYGGSLDDHFFPNIRRYYLHLVANKTLVLHCIKVLKWIIDHRDLHKILINDENGGCVGVFLSTEA